MQREEEEVMEKQYEERDVAPEDKQKAHGEAEEDGQLDGSEVGDPPLGASASSIRARYQPDWEEIWICTQWPVTVIYSIGKGLGSCKTCGP